MSFKCEGNESILPKPVATCCSLQIHQVIINSNQNGLPVELLKKKDTASSKHGINFKATMQFSLLFFGQSSSNTILVKPCLFDNQDYSKYQCT